MALSDDQDAMIKRLVDSGRYASASEVVRAGLRLLQREEESRLLDKWLLEGLEPGEEKRISANVMRLAREMIRVKVLEGIEDARRDRFVDGEEFFSRWKERLTGLADSETHKSA